MTAKEIEMVRQIIHCMDTDTKQKISKEISCREMINSCLCYGTDYFKPIERWIFESQSYGIQSYAEDDAKYLGMNRVKELYEEQLADFKKAVVHKDVYTDNEGLSYNSIQWADEI